MDDLNLKDLCRTYPITAVLTAINIVFFLFLDLTGITETTAGMLNWGACYYPYVFSRGEYWRLITAVFMHFNISHLAGNMLALILLGYRLEKLLGHVQYLLVYLITGAGANLLSLLINNLLGPNYVTAGASGAIFGVIGALFAYLLLSRGSIDGVGYRQMIIGVIFLIYTSTIDSSVDFIGHAAGLVIGFLLGVLLYRIRERGR